MIGQREQPAIDLTRYHAVREWKDLRIYMTWLYNDDQDDLEPCMVIVPAVRRSGYRPACIALSAAFRYDDAKYCVKAAMLFNRDLGFEDNMQNVFKVAEAIHSHLRDLIVMPESPSIKQVNADARVTIGGKTTSVELIDYIPMPQA